MRCLVTGWSTLRMVQIWQVGMTTGDSPISLKDTAASFYRSCGGGV